MRLFGHPVHPLLVHFPVAFWTAGTLCDGMALAGAGQAWTYAWALLAAGIVTALPAMIAGLIDFVQLETRAVAAANRHMLLMGAAWAAYLGAFVSRSDLWAPLPDIHALPVALSAAGFCLMAIGGWYGGQLVYRHGAGVRARNGVPARSRE